MLVLKFKEIRLFSQQDLDLSVLVPRPGKQYHHVLLLYTS
jgi:hypothetical protein